jgi:hypothetical protein
MHRGAQRARLAGSRPAETARSGSSGVSAQPGFLLLLLVGALDLGRVYFIACRAAREVARQSSAAAPTR